MSLPTWMTPRIKECFGTMLEELLLHNTQAILVFTIYGVTINDANTKDQHFIPINELAQDSNKINGFLVDDPELYESPIEKAKESITDYTTLLELLFVDESTFILNPVFDEIKPEDLIDLEKLFRPLIMTNESTVNNNGEGPSSITVQKEENTLEEAPKEKAHKSETWKLQLEKLVKQIYTEEANQIEKTITYYRIGKLISQTPTKYKCQQYKIKEELSTSIGIRIREKPFTIARNTYKLFKNENQIQQQKNLLNVIQIRRMKKNEIKEFRKNS